MSNDNKPAAAQGADSRARFEAWAVAQSFRASNLDTARDSEWYVSDITALAWRAWQASPVAAAPVDPNGLILDLRAAVSIGRPLLHSDVDEIERALASAPAAPGIDLAQFKYLIGFAAWSAINLPETDPRRDFIRQASELLALIDASPKGGSTDAKDAARYRHLRKLTPYRFKKMQDAAATDAGDVVYFHADRFDTALDADMQATSHGAGVSDGD